jgi:MATE family multidrug resistance protein
MSYVLFSFGFIKSTTTGYIAQLDHLAHEKTVSSIYQIFIISSLISFLLLFFKDILINYSLNIIGESGSINDNAKTYLDIRFWSIPSIFIRDIFIGYLIGIKKVSKAMKIIISINLLNVILDYLFVYIYSMNIEGVAYASLIAESSIVFFIINHLFHDRRFMNKNIFLSSLNNLSKLKNKLIVNGNMFIRSIILMTCFAHFMSLSADYGEIILAANTILLNFFFIFSYGIDAFAHSTEVMVGNAVGEKNIKKYDVSIHSSFKLTLTIALLFLLFFLIFSNNIIYTITSHINVIQSVQENIIFLFMVVMFGSLAFCIDGILIGGLQHTRMRNVMIISGIIYFLSVYLLEFNLSSMIWYPFILFFITRSLLLIFSLSRIRRALFS